MIALTEPHSLRHARPDWLDRLRGIAYAALRPLRDARITRWCNELRLPAADEQPDDGTAPATPSGAVPFTTLLRDDAVISIRPDGEVSITPREHPYPLAWTRDDLPALPPARPYAPGNEPEAGLVA